MEFSVHFRGKTYNHDLVCTHIFEANPVEMKKAIITVSQSELNWKIASSEFYHHANSCDWIRKEFNRDYFVSEQEQKFPLAFALNTYNSAYQIFRFLKIIYRPHNVYCIHYDQKSEESFKKLMIYISVCLPNVIVPSKIENVLWGWHTIVDAQMNCMENLYELRHKFPWRYVITLCGKEVPLRTNKEIVDTLRKLNGTSAVELVGSLEQEIQSFWSFKHVLIDGEVIKSDQKLGPVPFNLTITKSMAYFGLSRAFVNFILHNEMAIKFRRFMDDTRIPDEHFIATLFKEGIIMICRKKPYLYVILMIKASVLCFPAKGLEYECYVLASHKLYMYTEVFLRQLFHFYLAWINSSVCVYL